MSVSVINRGGGESFKVSNGVSYNFDGTGTIKKWDFIRYKSSMTQKYTPEILNSSTEKIICCDMTSEESSYSDMSYVIAYITTSGSVYVQGVREDKGTSTIHYKTDLLKIYSSGDTSSAAKIKLVRLGDDVTQLGVVFDTSYGVYAALVKCMLFSNDVSISLWVSPKLVSGSIYKNRWDLSVLYYSPVTETIIFSANNTTGYYTKVGFYNSGSIVADTSVSKANIVTSSLPTGALVCPSSNALTPSSSSTQKKGNCFIQTKDSVLFWSYDAKNKTEQLTTLTNERGLNHTCKVITKKSRPKWTA